MSSVNLDDKNPLDEIIEVDFDKIIKLNKSFIENFNSNKSNKIKLIRYEDVSSPFCKEGTRGDIFCDNSVISNNIISQCIPKNKLVSNSQIIEDNGSFSCKDIEKNLYNNINDSSYTITCKKYTPIKNKFESKCRNNIEDTDIDDLQITNTTDKPVLNDNSITTPSPTIVPNVENAEHFTNVFSDSFNNNEVPCIDINTYDANIQYVFEDTFNLEPSTNYHYRIWSYNEDSDGNLRESPNYNYVSMVTPDLPPIYQYHEFGIAECNGGKDINKNYTPLDIKIKISADGINEGVGLDKCDLFDKKNTCSYKNSEDRKVWKDISYYSTNKSITDKTDIDKPVSYKINDCSSYNVCNKLELKEDGLEKPTLKPVGTYTNLNPEIGNLGRFNSQDPFEVGGTPDFINVKTNDPNEKFKVKLFWEFRKEGELSNDPNYLLYKKYPGVYKMNDVTFVLYYKKIGENNVMSQSPNLPEYVESTGIYKYSAELFELDPDSEYIIKLGITINSTFTLRNGYSLDFECKNYNTIEDDDFFITRTNLDKDKYIREVIDKEWIHIKTRKLSQSDCSFYYTNMDPELLYKMSSGNEIFSTNRNMMGDYASEVGKILENNKCKAVSELNSNIDLYKDKICQAKINYNIYCYSDCSDKGDEENCKNFNESYWNESDSVARENENIKGKWPKSILSWVKDNDDSTKILRSARCLHKDYHNSELRKWYKYFAGGNTGEGGFCVLPVPGRWLKVSLSDVNNCYPTNETTCKRRFKLYIFRNKDSKESC